MFSGIKDPLAPTFGFRDFLLWTAGIGTCLVILMAGLAFGPSGLGFAAVVALFLFALMVK